MSEFVRKIDSIALFRGVRNIEPLKSMREFVAVLEGNNSIDETIDSYGHFVSVLYELRPDADLCKALFDALISTPNPYLKMKVDAIIQPNEKPVSKSNLLIELTAQKELELLTELGSLNSYDFKSKFFYDGYLPDFTSSQLDLKAMYMKMIDNLPKTGYGIYAKYRSFKYQNGQIIPIKYPDSISVENLFCYESQREEIINNTKAFMAGKPAADTLLYGEPGTGKTSTVKAVVRKFEKEGLRLVELPKREINNLSHVFEILSQIPMKFVLLIDDVSFESNDERIDSLKSVLEGAVGGGQKNIIIYVTSNRRNMIKEAFSEHSDEIRSSDMITEKMSLSERFGLRVLFDKPNESEFIKIAQGLAVARGITMDEKEFELEVEKFALKNGGRSARLARQFVDSLDC